MLDIAWHVPVAKVPSSILGRRIMILQGALLWAMLVMTGGAAAEFGWGGRAGTGSDTTRNASLMRKVAGLQQKRHRASKLLVGASLPAEMHAPVLLA